MLREGQTFPAKFDLIANAMMASKNRDWFVIWNPSYSERIRAAQVGLLSVVVIGPPWLGTTSKQDIAAYVAGELYYNTPLTSLLAQMDGGFIVMIWSEAARTGIIAVDPIGRYALYYSASNGQVVWASHPEPVALLTKGEIRLNQEALNIYLTLKGVPAPWSLLEGIEKLPPAHLLVIRETGVEVKEYLSLKEAGAYEGSFLEAQEWLIHELRCSVEQCVAHSQPIGVFLSGGLDSTTVTTLACQKAPVRAFSVGYMPHYHTDESRYAISVAHSLGVPIEVYRFSSADVINLLDTIVACLPEPVADMALLPQVFLASYVSQSVKIVLDGTGADAIWGGSNKFVAEHYRHFYMRVPRLVRRGLIYPLVRLLPTSRRWPLTNRIYQARIFLRGAEIPCNEDRIFAWSVFLPHELVKKVLSTTWVLDKDVGTDILRALIREFGMQDTISRISYMTLRGISAGIELPKLAAVERLSGLFIHTPFLSNRLIRLAFSLPDSYKVSGPYGKLVLREAAKRIVPPLVFQRRKANFSPPVGQWLTGQLRELFWETLASNEGFFNLDAIRHMWWEQWVGWRDWSAELWAIFMLQHWWNQAGCKRGA